MDTHIRDEIERSFGDGPPLPTHDDLMRRARGSLRRRRLAEAGSTLAVALVAVTGVTLLGSGDGGDASQLPASRAPAAPRTSAAATQQPVFPPERPGDGTGVPVIRDPRLPADTPVDVQADGLHVSPDVEVERLLDDPWGVRSDGDWSVAVAYTAPGAPLTWWVGYLGADGSASAASIAAAYSRGLGFSAWAVAQGVGVRAGDPGGEGSRPPGGWPGITDLELVRFVEGTERLEPVDGVSLLRQRAHPDLPRSWAGPRDRSAVAEVELDGERYYVLARSAPGDLA
ncbi:MAG TPA: hypothetical protein VD864_02085, partial [Nocardioides sp.]|nr:hypothetical protein [Nocardioides sp.]